MSIKIHTCLLDRFVRGFQKKMLKERMTQSLEQSKRSLVDADCGAAPQSWPPLLEGLLTHSPGSFSEIEEAALPVSQDAGEDLRQVPVGRGARAHEPVTFMIVSESGFCKKMLAGNMLANS